MPRYLYLLRHAHSAEKHQGQTDKDRTLTSQGMQEALRMGTYMQKQNYQIDIIITSIAERAIMTSRYFAEGMKLDADKILEEEQLYEASTRTFLEYLYKLETGYQNVMCVGHNPVISYLAENLSKSEIGDMATAGLAILKFNCNTWKEISQGNGELVKYISPELISFG